MNNKGIISFVSGMICGVVIGIPTGYFIGKKRYEKKYKEYADETVAQMREILAKKEKDALNKAYGVTAAKENMPEENEQDIVTSSPKISNDISERLKENYKATNYAAVYGQLHTESSEKADETSKADEEEEEEYVDPVPDNEYAASRKKRKPRLISAQKVHDLPDEIDIKTLYLYVDDEVLADEESEEKIDDPELLLGDCLERYDFIGSNEHTIYVLNEELDTCYTVIKIYDSYEDTH